MQELRFTKSARRHRIGKARARHVMQTSEPVVTDATGETPETWTWIGDDDRGLELEIVALVKPECLLVIHVMPTGLRRKR